LTEFRSSVPSNAVALSKRRRVSSVCIRNLARPHHCTDTKRSRKMFSLSSSGNKPSKTGMEHCSLR
jgi:hypothetical protein